MLLLDWSGHQPVPSRPGFRPDGLSLSRDEEDRLTVADPERRLWRARRRQRTLASMSFPPDACAACPPLVALTETGRLQRPISPASPGKPTSSPQREALRSNSSPWPGEELDPSWSPDGHSLVFGGDALSVRASQEDALHTVDSGHSARSFPSRASAGLFLSALVPRTAATSSP